MDVIFFFQAEDGIRDLVRSRGLGDVYKRQLVMSTILFMNTHSLKIHIIRIQAKLSNYL